MILIVTQICVYIFIFILFLHTHSFNVCVPYTQMAVKRKPSFYIDNNWDAMISHTNNRTNEGVEEEQQEQKTL